MQAITTWLYSTISVITSPDAASHTPSHFISQVHHTSSTTAQTELTKMPLLLFIKQASSKTEIKPCLLCIAFPDSLRQETPFPVFLAAPPSYLAPTHHTVTPSLFPCLPHSLYWSLFKGMDLFLKSLVLSRCLIHFC